MARRSGGDGVSFAVQATEVDGDWAVPMALAGGTVATASGGPWWYATGHVEVRTGDGAYGVRVAVRVGDAANVSVVVQQRVLGGDWVALGVPETVRVGDLAADVWVPVAQTRLAAAQPATAARRYSDLGAVVTPSGVVGIHIEDNRFGRLVLGPTGVLETVDSAMRLPRVDVAVDPGHGGEGDPGAISGDGLREADLNLAVAEQIVAALRALGVSAALTRTADYNVSLTMRVRIAEALGARVLVSVHHNAPSPGPSEGPGAEVYVQSASAALARGASSRLGGLVYDRLTAALAMFEDVEWVGSSRAGVMRVVLPEGGDAYTVLHHSAMPTVLVEYGYMSNPSEVALFHTAAYRVVAAVSTAGAVSDYLWSARSGSPPQAEPRVLTPSSAPAVRNDPVLQ